METKIEKKYNEWINKNFLSIKKKSRVWLVACQNFLISIYFEVCESRIGYDATQSDEFSVEVHFSEKLNQFILHIIPTSRQV